MDHRPLAPEPTRSTPGLLHVEPLTSFGRFTDYLSAASRQLLATRGDSIVMQQYRASPEQPWQPRPTTPGPHWPASVHPERRLLTCIYLGFVVTGPIRPHHLAHLAGRLNQAVRAGILTYGTMLEPCAMQLAHGRVQVGLHTYEDRPLRYALFVYAYTADPQHALATLDWSFQEGGLPVDFPEHFYATPLRSENAPEERTPPYFWRLNALKLAMGFAWAAAWVWTGWNLAGWVDQLCGR